MKIVLNLKKRKKKRTEQGRNTFKTGSPELKSMSVNRHLLKNQLNIMGTQSTPAVHPTSQSCLLTYTHTERDTYTQANKLPK